MKDVVISIESLQDEVVYDVSRLSSQNKSAYISIMTIEGSNQELIHPRCDCLRYRSWHLLLIQRRDSGSRHTVPRHTA